MGISCMRSPMTHVGDPPIPRTESSRIFIVSRWATFNRHRTLIGFSGSLHVSYYISIDSHRLREAMYLSFRANFGPQANRAFVAHHGITKKLCLSRMDMVQ